MKLEVKPLLIVRPDAAPGTTCGVAQIRQTQGARLVREGAVVQILQGNGNEIHALYTPDEARELGNMLIAASYCAADAPVAIFGPPPPVPNGTIVAGGRQ